jgi:Uma2 family endonuclease
VGLTDEQFFLFCIANKGLNIERNHNRQIIIMAPTGSETSFRNNAIAGQIWVWNEQHLLGVSFDSNAGFTLPDGSVLSPDASWIAKERWSQVPSDDRKRFAHICPDFVVGLLPESDRLENLQEKMRQWIKNGCRLAWLIDPKVEKVYIYRNNGQSATLEGFDQTVSGEQVLPGFELQLQKLRI